MDPLFDFTGKIVLVTGGSRGLGLEMVRAFAARGADLIITSRKEDACEEVAKEVRALGRRALAIGAHAGKWDEIDHMLERAYAEFGRIDIAINNAGMGPAMSSADYTEDLFDKVVGLNFKGPFRIAAKIAQRMKEGEGGVIINVSSSGAVMPLPGVVPYGAAKAALNAMSRSLAAEFAPTVRVNVLSAGPFLTDIAKAWTPEMREKSTNLLGRPGKPEEIVTAALALASPHSSYVTGAFYQADGGY
ncbi:SDR family NAD(P)-dependent oxidoreductase [Sphingobium baderi]|uniref:SDR family NAD(P)-dependent oxidoreductase n=1 Tax=Sphingobium baderi TaxID=1332080 RepID=UPI002B416E80|nr:SDR family oxidoreductase [Sphingobium baderi]WRD75472.1 SDR family oxidoreductase [Sphingobium baderi]